MRILFVVLLFISGYVFACPEIDSAMSQCPSKSYFSKISGKVIADDLFMLKLTDELLAWKRIKKLYNPKERNITRASVPSIHTPESFNDIVVIKDHDDFLSYFFSGENSFPLCISVNSKTINSDPFPLVGQSLSFFQKKYGFGEDISSLTIDTLEGGNLVNLRFENGKVASFVYRSNYLD